MPSVAHTMQMTLSLDPALPERYRTLREYIYHLATQHKKLMKGIASDMDIGASTLSRKLNPAEGDTQRFNVDDLEAFLKSTGDVHAVVDYLLSKFAAQAEDERRERAKVRAYELLEQMPEILAAIGVTTLDKKGATRARR
jgi:hypothetical protein